MAEKLQEQKKQKFDLNQFLADQELKLQDVGEDGSIKVQLPDGSVGDLNTKSIEEDFGIKLADMEMIYNTKESPLEKSPVSPSDRFKLDIGNTKGGLQFLKKKFEEAEISEEHGLVVKSKGVWQKVDPEWWGNGDVFEMSKEILGDTAELGQEAIDVISSGVGAMIGSIIGGVGGGALAAPTGPGVVAGVGAGMTAGATVGSVAGGTLGARLRHSMGRAYGTYDASPEEQMNDEFWEGLMGLGGEAVGVGAKVAGPQIVKAMKSISEGANNRVREAVKSGIRFFNETTDDNIDLFLDAPDRVMGKIDTLKKMAEEKGVTPTTANLKELVKKSYIGQTEALLDKFPKKLSAKFGATRGRMLADPSIQKFDLDVAQPAVQTLGEMQNSGLVKYVDGKFVAQDATQLLKELEGTELISKPRAKELNVLKDAVGLLNNAVKQGRLQGKEGAQNALQIRSVLGDLQATLGQYGSRNASAFAGSLEAPLRAMRNSLNEGFQSKNLSANVRESFEESNKLWRENASKKNIVQALNYQIKNNRNMGDVAKIESFVNKMSGNQLSFAEFADDLSKTIGDEPLTKNFAELRAAVDFLPMVPTFKGISGGIAAGGILGATGTSLGTAAAIGGGVLAATGPRQLGTVGKYTLQTSKAAKELAQATGGKAAKGFRAFKSYMATLDPVQRKKLMSDERAVGQMFGAMFNADAYNQEVPIAPGL